MDIFLSSSLFKDIEDSVNFAQENNLNLEISRFGDIKTLDRDFDNLLEYFKKTTTDFRGKLSLHGFFLDVNPVAQDPQLQQISEKRFRQSFKIAKEVGAKTVVFHSGFNGLVKHHIYKKCFIEDKIKFWQHFIKQFEQEGITAVVENTYENDPETLINIVDSVNSNNLKMCIDTGHVNINSTFSCSEWIKAVGNNLHHMHLHNNAGDFDDHRSVLNGSLDFNKILNTLNEENLCPNMVVEIFNTKSAMESVEFIKNYRATVYR